MVVSQGDLFWVDLGEPAGSRPGFRQPFVTIDKGELIYRIGRLGRDRVADVLRGIDLGFDPLRTADSGTAAR